MTLTKLDSNKEIIISNKKYKISITDTGYFLERFNSNSKMWVQINFPKKGDLNIDKLIIRMLSDAYIENCLN